MKLWWRITSAIHCLMGWGVMCNMHIDCDGTVNIKSRKNYFGNNIFEGNDILLNGFPIREYNGFKMKYKTVAESEGAK